MGASVGATKAATMKAPLMRGGGGVFRIHGSCVRAADFPEVGAQQSGKHEGRATKVAVGKERSEPRDTHGQSASRLWNHRWPLGYTLRDVVAKPQP